MVSFGARLDNYCLSRISLRTIKILLICLISLWLMLMVTFIAVIKDDEGQIQQTVYRFFANEPEVFNDVYDISLIPPFPIDIVYTWAGEIDVSKLNETYLYAFVDAMKKKEHTILPHLRNNNELKYSLHSVYNHIAWIRKIYIIHNDDCNCPSWLNYTKLKQNNIFIDKLFNNITDINPDEWKIKIKNKIIAIECLKGSILFNNPEYGAITHSGQSFELRLHHIPDLSEHYIYFNDDFFIFRDISYLFFFNSDGIPRYPSTFWKNYKNISVNKIYSASGISRNNIEFDIPYTVKTKQLFYEHMPRPTLKSNWFDLENKYYEWFNFTEKVHIPGNFCPLKKNRIGCFNDNPHRILLAYRVLNKNRTNKAKQSVKKAYNELSRSFLSKFKMESMNFKINQNNIHIWVKGHKNRFNTTNKMESLLNKIEKYHPITFNMNDVWHNKLHIYKMQIIYLLNFFKKHFPDNAHIDIDIDFKEP